MKKSALIIKSFIAIVVSLSAGFIGSMFTQASIPTWYASLNKPVLTPPNWVFGPVWSTLYVVMGISAGLVWNKGLQSKGVKKALIVFIIQLVLNTLWSVSFFGLQNPLLGLFVIAGLLALIVWTMILFYRISKTAGLLLIPYLLWTLFASYLNYSIWVLN